MNYDELIEAIESFAPLDDYVEIDSSGIQLKTGSGEFRRILVCLEINDDVIDEAVRENADMIVTHHPMLFYPVKNICDSDVPGRYIIKLIEHGISVYSSHLPFDFCPTGNNAYLAKLLGLEMDPVAAGIHSASGSFREPVSLDEACRITEKALDLPEGYLRVVDGGKAELKRVGLCTGAGGDMIDEALGNGCDLYVTGDLKLHEAQYAKAMGISVIDAGHYGTEKIFAENFAAQLREVLGDRADVIEAVSDTNPYTL